MKSKNKYPDLLQAGFTLVELMVGLTIGLLATVIIMQVFTVFETQKRTTTGTADAQTNGNIALYDIQREMEMAGYALLPVGLPGVPDSPLECTTLTSGATGFTNISPVTIIDGGASGGSDSIVIRFGSSSLAGTPMQITATPYASTRLASPALDVPVSSNLGCKDGDIALVVNSSVCALTSVPVSGVPAVVSGVPNTILTLADSTSFTTGAAANKANISCLGNWNEITYFVNSGNLVRQVVTAVGASSAPVVAGVVNLQAQYGVSAAGLSSAASNFNQVQQWVNATGTWATPGISIADRNRIKAIRLAVVARNAKNENTVVTNGCSITAPNGPCSWDAASASAPVASPAPAIDLTPYGTSWPNYRYRVFDTIIPLRNVIWSRGTL